MLLFTDGAGGRLIPYEGVKVLSQKASVAVFSHWNTLMGSGVLGANPLADLCQELENGGKTGNWQEIAKTYAHLHPLFEAMVRFIDAGHC